MIFGNLRLRVMQPASRGGQPKWFKHLLINLLIRKTKSFMKIYFVAIIWMKPFPLFARRISELFIAGCNFGTTSWISKKPTSFIVSISRADDQIHSSVWNNTFFENVHSTIDFGSKQKTLAYIGSTVQLVLTGSIITPNVSCSASPVILIPAWYILPPGFNASYEFFRNVRNSPWIRTKLNHHGRSCIIESFRVSLGLIV